MVTLLKQKMHQQNQIFLTGGVPVTEEDSAAGSATDGDKDVVSSAEHLTTGMHQDDDQNHNTATLSNEAFFVTEGDASSPMKQPTGAANDAEEERPLLEEYFQPAIEGRDNLDLNQTNDANFYAMGEVSSERQVQQDTSQEGGRQRRSQRKVEYIAAKREEARSKMAYSLENPVGLPPEAFDDFLDSGGLTVGVNYLRTLKHTKMVGSEKVDLYGNLMVKKRPSTTHVQTLHNFSPQAGGYCRLLHQWLGCQALPMACSREVPQPCLPRVTTATLWGIPQTRCR